MSACALSHCVRSMSQKRSMFNLAKLASNPAAAVFFRSVQLLRHPVGSLIYKEGDGACARLCLSVRGLGIGVCMLETGIL